MLRTDMPDSAASCSIVSPLGESDGATWGAEDTPRLKLAAQKLARRRPRQIVGEPHCLWHLEPRQPGRAVGLQLVWGHGEPVAQDDCRDDRLTPLGVLAR